MAAKNKNYFENGERESVRINKALADAGICSRRGADELIAQGRVTIDGVKAETGTTVTPENVIAVDGKVIKNEEKLVLIALNKPRGIVCTTDTSEPDNVIDFLHYGKRIFPIGRLDKDSEGLLLLTNDGDIVNKILRSGNNHEKEYVVRVNGLITPDFLKGMASGVPILDTVTKPCKVTQISKNEFSIILTQGLNRQIRRMCEYFGYSVTDLKRVRIMNIRLGRLKSGDYRNVTPAELEGLRELIKNSRGTAFIPENDEDATVLPAKVPYVKTGAASKGTGSKSVVPKNSRSGKTEHGIKKKENNRANNNGRYKEKKTGGAHRPAGQGGKSVRAGRPRNNK